MTILPVGDAGGGTQFNKRGPRFSTREDYERQVMVLLAGRGAEELLLDAPSQGAGGAAYSDIGKATVIVASMFASMGLGDSLLYRGDTENALALLAVDRHLELEVHKAMEEIYKRTLKLLAANRSALVAIADDLMAKRFMSRAEVESSMAKASFEPAST